MLKRKGSPISICVKKESNQPSTITNSQRQKYEYHSYLMGNSFTQVDFKKRCERYRGCRSGRERGRDEEAEKETDREKESNRDTHTDGDTERWRHREIERQREMRRKRERDRES